MTARTTSMTTPMSPTSSTAERWQVTSLEIASVRALRHAGNWLRGKVGRHARLELEAMPRYTVHTAVEVPRHRIDEIMHGALDELRIVEPDQLCLHALVEDYVRSLLISGHQHQRDYLVRALAYTDCDAA